MAHCLPKDCLAAKCCRTILAGFQVCGVRMNWDKALECNDALVRLLGYSSRAEVLAHNVRDSHWHPVERAQLVTRLRPGLVINNHEMP